MVYSVLIGQSNYSENVHPVKFTNNIVTYPNIPTISMSSANTQNCNLSCSLVLDENRKVFGFEILNFKARFGHISMKANIICSFVPYTSGLSEYKLFRKPGTDYVFGVIYNNGTPEWPYVIPTEWQDYTKDQYMIDYIAVDFSDLHFSRSDDSNNAVVINFDVNGGPLIKVLRVGYKHENTITTGTYLIDVFVGESIDSSDYGIHYATVYENDVGTNDLFTYQVPTMQPYQLIYKGDGSFANSFKTTVDSINEDITELQDIVGPLTDRIGSLRSQYTTR